MKINDWLSQATAELDKAGIGTARLDALVLAEDVTGQKRSYLLAHPEYQLTSEQVSELVNKLERRASHEPLSYIRGKTEFYGREFIVDKHVLEPRPESETMIDLLKKIPVSDSNIVDVGTGSGALAITAKLELPSVIVEAVDIDPGCLAVAKRNARKYSADIKFSQANLLQPLSNQRSYTLLCNLPYVPDSFTINQAAMREPKIAIFGGPDGLDLYRQLFGQIKSHQLNIQYILTESLPTQHQTLVDIAKHHGYRQQTTDDFIQLFVKN